MAPDVVTPPARTCSRVVRHDPLALEEAGVQDDHAVLKSHRLRDTFACEFLSRGGEMEKLSELLGHSSLDTTRQHYAPWDKRRQDLLDAAVEMMWDAVPSMEQQVAALRRKP